MFVEEYNNARKFLLSDNCKALLQLEEKITGKITNMLLSVADNIRSDFDASIDLQPFWRKYAPIQRGYKPRNEAFPWGEVGEKVLEGYLYALIKTTFANVRFLGLPYGHDVRFATDEAFIHIDSKSTGPTDNPDEIVSSPNQVTGSGILNHDSLMENESILMKGPRIEKAFLPELSPFYIYENRVLPTITLYIKIVYDVKGIGNQPLDYLEIICVPNGLALFDGPKLINVVQGLFTPGKDEQHVARRRTRIKLNPLSKLGKWRTTKIRFTSSSGPVLEFRA